MPNFGEQFFLYIEHFIVKCYASADCDVHNNRLEFNYIEVLIDHGCSWVLIDQINRFFI